MDQMAEDITVAGGGRSDDLVAALRRRHQELTADGAQSLAFELRLPDGSCNAYLATAGIIAAGLDGVQRKLDELLRATAGDNRLIAVEEAPDEELQALADLNLDDRAAAVDPGAAPLER